VKFHDDPTSKAVDDVTVKLHDDPTLKAADDFTVKFHDDPTSKDADDVTVKLHDDLTLKAADDVTVKLHDDPTLKAADDVTVKLHDDPTLKAADDGTVKSHDDITIKVIDDGGSLKIIDDGIPGGNPPGGDPPFFRGAGGNVPFILSTPHHSMAWAAGGSTQQAPQPGAPSQAQQYEAALAALEQQIQSGWQQLNQLDAQYRTMLAEYKALGGQR